MRGGRCAREQPHKDIVNVDLYSVISYRICIEDAGLKASMSTSYNILNSIELLINSDSHFCFQFQQCHI